MRSGRIVRLGLVRDVEATLAQLGQERGVVVGEELLQDRPRTVTIEDEVEDVPLRATSGGGDRQLLAPLTGAGLERVSGLAGDRGARVEARDADESESDDAHD